MPTKRQLALIQQAAYGSQGRAVRKVARTQRAIGVGRPSISAPRARQIVAQRQAVAQRNARAQQQQYVSQGQAVRRAAAHQRVQAAARAQRVRVRNAQIQARAYEREAHRLRTQMGPPTPSFATQNRSRLEREFLRYQPKTNPQHLRALATADLEKKLKANQQAFGPNPGGGPKLKLGAGATPALKALDIVTKPLYASAGATHAALTGQNVPKAIGRAITGKERTTFSTALRDVGVHNKLALAIGGFGADVLLDPSTYVTFGATSVAREAALSAGRRAAEDASARAARELAPKVRSGEITRKQARAQARQTGERVGRTVTTRRLKSAKAQHHQSGLGVKLAGGKTARKVARRAGRTVGVKGRGVGRVTRVAPLTRTSAAVRSGVKGRLPRSERVTRVRRGVRDIGAEAHGDIRPTGVTAAEQTSFKGLQRETRATGEKGTRESVVLAHKIRKLSAAELRIAHDAIEANRLGTIKDPKLRLTARQMRDQFRHEERLGRRSGALAGRVGEKGRTVKEVEQFGARAPARSVEPLRRELKTAEADFVKARTKLRAATTPRARQGAQQTLKRVSQRVTNLRGQITARETQAARYATQSKGLRESRNRRFQREARGYVPRVLSEDLTKRTVRSDVEHGIAKMGTKIRRQESVGVTKPKASSAKRREHRQSLARLRETNPDLAARFETVSPEVVARYGSSMRRAAAQADLNRGIVEQFGQDIGKGGPITKSDLHAMEREGTHAVYRLRRGNLEKLGPEQHAEINLASQRREVGGRRPSKSGPAAPARTSGPVGPRATKSAAQYTVLRRDVAARAYDRGASDPTAIAQAFDRGQSAFKSVALMTPGYLVRNMAGDLWNAYTNENVFRLTKNVVKGRKVLAALGDHERAARKLRSELPPDLREIKLNPQQIESVAHLLKTTPEKLALEGGKANALQLAVLAEKAGAIRQGRFLELVQEGGKVPRARGIRAFQETAKRVEDSVRIATFLGSLERGATVREASQRVSKIHFDYGDLTPFEKKVLRRAMPFYTFTSRNIPLQAKAILRSPGKYAHLQAAREEGRQATDLPEGYEKGLDPFEQRQLGIPIKVGGQTATVSLGMPFVDLNDVAGAVKDPIGVAVRKAGELGSPAKVLPELVFNYSLFYRDQIEKQGRERTLTATPGWAVAAGKTSPLFRKATGMVPDYVDQKSGKTIWAWPRKVDYAARQIQLGPARVLASAPGVGVPTTNARGFPPVLQALTTLGPRIKPYEPARVQATQLYAESNKLDEQMSILRGRRNPNGRGPINSYNPTPEYDRLRARARVVQAKLDKVNRASRAVYKGRVVKAAAKSGGWGASNAGSSSVTAGGW